MINRNAGQPTAIPGSGALAGLTDNAAFFCLERLAMNRGLRVVFKGEHRRLASGALSHLIAGPGAVVTQASLTGLTDRSWASRTARLAAAALGAGPISARLEKATQAAQDQPPLLISWVLAPKAERRI